MSTGFKTTTGLWDKNNLGISPVIPPSIRDRTIGEYFFGVDGASTVFNYADPATPMTVQGTPTYNSHSAVVRSSATAGYGFKTGIIPPLGFSLLQIRKQATVTASPIVSGFIPQGGGASYGMHEFGSNLYMNGGEGLSINGCSRAKPGAGLIFFEMATSVDFGGNPTARYGSGGALTDLTSASAVSRSRMNADNTNTNFKEICFGTTSLTDTITTNTTEFYWAAIIAGSLTDAEALAIYTALRSHYTALSITVE